MARKDETAVDHFMDSLREVFQHVPAWVGPLLALVCFCLIRFGGPAFIPAPKAGVDLAPLYRMVISLFSWIVPCAVLLCWAFAEIDKLRNRRLLEGQTGLESIRGISWQQFEQLVAEAYRRRGYVAQVVGTSFGDGGVDIVLSNRDGKVLIQCKQWKNWRVGVRPVRELLGVMISEKAVRCIMVTSGRYTKEAQSFAKTNPIIELMDGHALANLIQNVQVGAEVTKSTDIVASSGSPACPECGASMVRRTARKGHNAGNQFWGCPKYPSCRGIRS